MTASMPRYSDGSRPHEPGEIVLCDVGGLPVVERADEWVLFSDELCRELGAHDHEPYPEVISLGTEDRGLGRVRYQRVSEGTLSGTQLYRRQP